MISALSFGGGVNSTAMLLELCNRGNPPSIVLFADTGGEFPQTYAHVREMQAWCAQCAIPWQTVSNAGRGQGDTLEENCLERKELPSLAYGFKGCSAKWKRQPMDRFLSAWGPAVAEWQRGEKVTRYIGIDAGEAHRATLTEDTKFRYAYPLVEWDIDRDGCLDIIAAAGLQPPRKSSCFFCPAMRKHEILQLAEDHPDLAERAIQMERNAVTTSVAGLGRSWRWADLINADKRQQKLWPGSGPAVPCGCHDEADEGEVRP